MALGDVLAGLAEAGHQHRTNLLQMDYEKKKDLADKYFEISQSQDYPSEMRAEALKRTVGLHTLEPEKKLPKEWENMTFTVQPKAPSPINVPGSDGTNAQSLDVPGSESIPQSATAAINPRTIQPPTPPAHDETMRPKTFAEHLAEAHDTALMQGDVKTQTELRDINQRYDFLKQKFGKDLPEPAIAAMATGHAPPSLSFAVPGTMDENQVLQTTGQPVPPGHYAVRMTNGSWLATPVEAKVSGGTKFAVDNKTGKPVAYSTDQYGKVKIEPDVDLTPIQMLPTTVTSNMPRIVQQPDGSLTLEQVPSSSTRTRGGVQAPVPPTTNTSTTTSTPTSSPLTPTPPPNNAPTPAPVPALTTSTKSNTSGKVIGGRSLTPNEVQNNQTNFAAADNFIDRMTSVLMNADKFASLATRVKLKLASDPAHEGRLTIAGAVAPLTKEEAKFAGDYLSSTEDVNLLRKPFEAAGFRGPEARTTQQAQVGLMTGDFNLFKTILSNTTKAMLDQVNARNKAMIRAGQPYPLTAGIKRAYMLLHDNNATKAAEAAVNDGWVK